PELPENLHLPSRSQQPGNQDVDSVDDGTVEDVDLLPPGIGYPEWDHGTGRYLANGAIVRSAIADEGDEAWANAIIASNATLLRRVQQQFERLRARRIRLLQQRRGDEIDIAACVRAIIDRRAGLLGEDRLYTDVRPARRGLAISLLVDVSGSTDMQVTHALQVIDIEKLAVLLATKAFDALGDSYNVLTFTGRGASDVRMKTVKAFSEPSGAAVRRRIAALRPEGGTRMGAAVRHAVSLLANQPAGHRLLLMLSDGRPNDIGYLADYAIEDARQSILEARAAGIFPFCLTVDRDGAEYLAHVFGSAGHVIIRNPEQLPSALLRAVRHLLRFA
ncbi:MAG TPA: VWA domain-containing protein, partial [Gemmatimonas sp.]|nr:VWA domain-containing protein [Gemmatimonas sp.]